MNSNSYLSAEAAALNSFMTKVFVWMFAGLLLTSGISFMFAAAVISNETAAQVANNPIFLIALVIAEFALVIKLSRSLDRLSEFAAKAMFLVYAGLNGLTISYVFFAYTASDVTRAFIYAAVFFGVMAAYGYFTKADLTRAGNILTVGLITIIIASVINVFLRSGGLDFLICLAGVGIFVGLTAWDVQRIKSNYYGLYAAGAQNEAMVSKIAVFGALRLYLDFVNLFLYILRLLGRRR